ncbi:polyphosphate glucokinase [Cutibacterium acnes JCM 18916]|nr:polyphosphate glucokinase [Cutibacterium acnes JCM 18916]
MLREIVDNFAPTIGDGPVGISFPAPARHGVIPFIANLDQVGPACTPRNILVTLSAAQ